MEMVEALFGTGDDLRVHQMAARAVVVFFLAMGLVRLSGRRSFGMKSPLDNVITILLGAVLSRGLVGASPFLATLGACLVLVLLHRLLCWVSVKSARIETWIKGERRPLYENGRINRDELLAALISEKDLLEGLVTKANVNSLDAVESVHLERDGEIGVIRKEKH